VEVSARNQLNATITSVQVDGIMAEVVMQLPDGQELVAAITRSSAERLGLHEGDAVTAVIKATEIMVAVS
jgi:molybdopterin-binding protein